MAAYRSTGKELRKSPKGLIAGLLSFLLAAGTAYGIKYVLDGIEPVTSPAESTEISVPDLAESNAESTDGKEYGTETLAASELHHGPLVLISNDYPTEDLTEGIYTVFEKKLNIMTVRDMTVLLHEDASAALNALAEGFQKETGLTDLLVLNGYITKENQKKRYEADLQRTGKTESELYALPGCSEFESGYSFELSLYSHGNYLDFTTDDEHKWIAEHCADYGIIQRYPEGSEQATGVSNRPEVFRYVGKPHAYYMHENSLSLEEYTAMLEEHPYDGEHFRLTDADGQEYEVYYVPFDPSDPSSEAEIPVPVGYTFNVSGNNKHGFIVTAELD